jgi:hypothetical protein
VKVRVLAFSVKAKLFDVAVVTVIFAVIRFVRVSAHRAKKD